MSDKPDKQELAGERTNMAEDRTVLANERTFASWFRTGFAAVAIGLGFQALFIRMEPWWAPRGIATIFFVLGILIFVVAERRACAVLQRLHTHKVQAFGNSRLKVMTIMACAGVTALIAAMWFLPISLG